LLVKTVGPSRKGHALEFNWLNDNMDGRLQVQNIVKSERLAYAYCQFLDIYAAAWIADLDVGKTMIFVNLG